MKFNYGFDYKGLRFGWHKKKLFRLPSTVNKKSYPLKELSKITIGKKYGYRVNRDKKTIEQLMALTEKINYTHVINGKDHPDCPF